MRRYELSDQEWAVIEPLLPPPAETGRPRVSARLVWNAIFWVLRSGAPWRDLPERYGPWQSVYHHFNAWRREGVFDKILAAMQIRLDAEGHIDWDLFCVDGSNVRASRSAAGAGFPLDVTNYRFKARVDGRYWVQEQTTTKAGSTASPVVILE